ncbi:hypothetical protein CEXT_515941 [Caerostris extrusa]|uniref:Uncharacterized protein n=1 Tax=Caerostris extrusa TaxID=172846 RepID=A0AAV4UVN8_CAEEX|nr:hypothetical protein CEXT_515941 [Caerostris extrusa]
MKLLDSRGNLLPFLFERCKTPKGVTFSADLEVIYCGRDVRREIARLFILQGRVTLKLFPTVRLSVFAGHGVADHYLCFHSPPQSHHKINKSIWDPTRH